MYIRSFITIVLLAAMSTAPAQADHRRDNSDAAAMIAIFGLGLAIIASQKGHGHHHQKVVVPDQNKHPKVHQHLVQQAKKGGLRCADSKLHQMDNNFAPHGGGEHWHKKKGPNRHSHGMCY